MKNRVNNYETCGTSALKPDCSRYRNENEHIVEFPRSAQEKAHPKPRKRLGKLRQLLDDDVLVNDLRTGSARGKKYEVEPRWKTIAIGCAYAACALATVFIAV